MVTDVAPDVPGAICCRLDRGLSLCGDAERPQQALGRDGLEDPPGRIPKFDVGHSQIHGTVGQIGQFNRKANRAVLRGPGHANRCDHGLDSVGLLQDRLAAAEQDLIRRLHAAKTLLATGRRQGDYRQGQGDLTALHDRMVAVKFFFSPEVKLYSYTLKPVGE